MKMRLMLLLISMVMLQGKIFSQQVSPSSVYNLLSSEDYAVMANTLQKIGEPESARDSAFKGVLLMKAASGKDGAGEKLETFKAGHELLEGAIMKDPGNTEFRFFRLVIQENAPKILGYHKDIEADAALVIEQYPRLSEQLKNTILAYSEHSKNLRAEDFE